VALALLAAAGLLGLAVFAGRVPPGSSGRGKTGTEVRAGLMVRLRGALPETAGPVLGVAFSPGSEVLATAGDDRLVRLWDLATNRVRVLRGHSARVWSVAFAPDGKTLASAGGEWHDPEAPQAVKVWNASTGRELRSLHGHTALVFCVAFAPDGRTLASAGWDGTVRIWDPASGKEKARLDGHTAPVRFLAFSPDGKTLATGSFDETARLWDVASGKELLRLDTRPYKVNCVAFSPDGKTLATAENLPAEKRDQVPELSGPGQVRLWDLRNRNQRGEQRALLRGPSGMILTVTFAPDGKTLVSAGGQWKNFGEITVWDIPQGQGQGQGQGRERLTLLGHTEWVEAVAFAPDGRTLVTAGGTLGSPSEVKLWDVNPSPSNSNEGQRRPERQEVPAPSPSRPPSPPVPSPPIPFPPVTTPPVMVELVGLPTPADTCPRFTLPRP
jgi:WD40 repeat protein